MLKFFTLRFIVYCGSLYEDKIILECVQTNSGTHPGSYPMGSKGSFPGAKVAGVVKLTTHLHLVPRSRMHEAVPPLPNMPPWHGSQLKKAQGQFYLFTFTLDM
jgi:hypothetical protein